MSNFDAILRELFPPPKSWNDIVPDCTCSKENDFFCPACMRWYIDISYGGGFPE